MDDKKKAKVVLFWKALCAIMAHKKEVDLITIRVHLSQAPYLHQVAAQAILAISGCAVEGFDPDGNWGDLSIASLNALHEANKKALVDHPSD